MNRTALVSAAVALTAGAALHTANIQLTPTALAQENQDGFAVDQVHSSVYFELDYGNAVGISAGRFNDFSGVFDFDEDAPSSSMLSFTIDARTIDTNNADRDRHLRSPDFFNAGRYPEITFTSNSVRMDGDMFKVTGDISMLGETKEITVDVKKIGEGAARGGATAQGITSVFTITRSEFGMNYGIENGALGDDVTVTVHAYGKK